ncbi:MAG: hypothetical protein JSS39_03285 [Nitrospira sp.]|nr:hypothetical protein [Nitrospira sp.]
MIVILSPTHLKAAVETVTSFGKLVPIRPETHQANGKEALISNGTVTEEKDEGQIPPGGSLNRNRFVRSLSDGDNYGKYQKSRRVERAWFGAGDGI